MKIKEKSNTELLFLINKNKEKHESIKAEIFQLLDEIDKLGELVNLKENELSVVEDEYVELWMEYNKEK
jgi:hypothetical protein